MTNYLDAVGTDKLGARITADPAEILAAQKLRYQCFIIEEEVGDTTRGGTTQSFLDVENGVERDYFDEFCEHLIVTDKIKEQAGASPDEYVVGTYRLMRREGAKRAGQWFSELEFDVEKFMDYPGEVLELGRSCVAQEYRTKMTLAIMWNALAAYMFDNNIELMFGCGTFLGTNLDDHKEALALLKKKYVAEGKWACKPKGPTARPFPPVPDDLDDSAALLKMPPIIKGYLRAGCKVSDGLFLDEGWGCFDILIIFEIKDAREHYREHYSRRIK